MVAEANQILMIVILMKNRGVIMMKTYSWRKMKIVSRMTTYL
jgi:hypothetical protein